MNGFYKTGLGYVKDNWIDINGHMNISYYTPLFDKSTFSLLNEIGINKSSIKKGLPTVVASRLYISYRKELLKGDKWELWSGFAKVDEEHLSISHRLLSINRTYAVCDIKGTVILPQLRTKGKLSKEVLKTAENFVVPGLKDRFACNKL